MALGTVPFLCYVIYYLVLLMFLALIVWIHHVSHQIFSSSGISIMVSGRTPSKEVFKHKLDTMCDSPIWFLNSKCEVLCHFNISVLCHFWTSFLSSRFDHLLPGLLLQLSTAGWIPALFTFNPFSLMQPKTYLLKCKYDLITFLLKIFHWFWNIFKVQISYHGIRNILWSNTYLVI